MWMQDAGCIMEYGCLMLVMIIATLSPAFLCITCRAPLLHFSASPQRIDK
jgi:hypothetical protein